MRHDDEDDEPEERPSEDPGGTTFLPPSDDWAPDLIYERGNLALNTLIAMNAATSPEALANYQRLFDAMVSWVEPVKVVIPPYRQECPWPRPPENEQP